eukprot:CAMPEP_0114394418 /NCGR_PEP_ID=MMETSP0102-20121206/12185_1 /TAXON_ID=38822 ORGANISM="Pteridomonas danica, Strain PT" /NCGR_SAMPLE_ID=MMETSP0102 /ASSEMBLY_ACC=CAM_ASM_000212 /LENGTH=114 /DNA_ID=CAMNT_0001554391 /DNA_START=184 /DNA_END=528 /DNA_ORIENTATION=+
MSPEESFLDLDPSKSPLSLLGNELRSQLLLLESHKTKAIKSINRSYNLATSLAVSPNKMENDVDSFMPHYFTQDQNISNSNDDDDNEEWEGGGHDGKGATDVTTDVNSFFLTTS